MRSIQELLSITKNYHRYWNCSPDAPPFMCRAARIARQDGEITQAECQAVIKHCESLVRKTAKENGRNWRELWDFSLSAALGSGRKVVSEDAIKSIWESHFAALGGTKKQVVQLELI